MGRRFSIRPDVRKILGPKVIKSLQTDPAYRELWCFRCRKRVHSDDGRLLAVSVVVAYDSGRQSARMRFSHPACAPSEVFQGHPEHERDRVTDLKARMLDLGGLPFLIIARAAPGFGRAPDGSLVDTWGDYFREAGFSEVRREGIAIPEPLTGWEIVIAAPVIEIHHPNGMVDTVAFDEMAEEWQASIRRHGFCMLCSGSKINLAAWDLQGWLNRGELYAAPVSVVWRG